MSDDLDLDGMFTQEAYETILHQLAADSEPANQLSGLSSLSKTLIYGDGDAFGDFPSEELATKLTQLLRTTTLDAVREQASLCIGQFLDARQDSIPCLINAGALPVVARTLSAFTTPDTVQHCVAILRMVADLRSLDLAQQVGIAPLLEHFASLRPMDQRSAGQTILKILERHVDPSFAGSAGSLLRAISHAQPPVRASLAQGLALLVRGPELEIGILEPLIELANAAEDGACALAYVSALRDLSKRIAFGRAMLPNRINFERLFFGPDWQGNTQLLRRAALNIILKLLPDVDLPADFWVLNNRTLPLTEDFAVEIQPLALRLLFAKAGRDNLILATIASTLSVKPFAPSEDFLGALIVLASSNDLAPYVLLVAKALPDRAAVGRLLPLLRVVTPPPKVAEWYSANLAKFAEVVEASRPADSESRTFESIGALCEFVGAARMTPFQFHTSGMLKHACELLHGLAELPGNLIGGIELIVELAHGMLAFLPMPNLADPLSASTLDSLRNRSVTCDLQIGSQTMKRMSIGIELALGALEAWNNTREGRVPLGRFVTALAESEYQTMFSIADPEQLPYTNMALIGRALGVPENRLYHFRINNKLFSAFDCLFHAIARAISDPGQFDQPVVIEFLEGDIPRAPLVVLLNLSDSWLATLGLLEIIHKLCPEIDLSRPGFSRQICLGLSSPLLTMGFHSIQSRILYHFPFLFDLETRRSFFRIVGFDLTYSLPYMNTYFHNVPWNHRQNQMRITCRVHRDRIYEDGIQLLKFAGPGMLRVDVTYEGEEGIGVGPTQDFFAKLAREFCAKRLGLWRDESNEGDVAWTTRGMFPAPNAPPEQFYFLGLLVGKALLMDVLIPFPFSPAFLKLVLGEPVDVAEVDPMLARSLANPDGLIGWAPFTYPGIPSLELVPGGANVEVSSSNVAEFVELVKKKTVELGEIVGEFRRGLSTVVQWELLKLFTPKEIDLILCGELPQISKEELVESVAPSHGYTAESPQMSMFFDVVAGLDRPDQGLFIKFVTGMDRLPFGGLKALNPQLTVAPRSAQDGESADATLPSVMTCANYFKLPMYSSREVMRERILKAIHECQDCFMLT